jgi:hypothetical protein
VARRVRGALIDTVWREQMPVEVASVDDPIGPAISVVIVTPDRFDSIRTTVRHLRAQSARDRLELVVVAPSAEHVADAEPELRDFPYCRVVEVGPITSTAHARAAGIRAASAPLVALAEDHSFPAPGWAAALIEAHRQPWAAVGPQIGNANPEKLMGWANLLLEYGPWLAPAEAGPVEHLPGHNGSYKRAVLLEYGADLAPMLEAETTLHWDLRARGHRLYLEPAARVDHLNFSRPSTCLTLRFNGGRLFAACRSRRWSPARRLLYAAATPLIPLVRLRRVLRTLCRPGRPRWLLPRVLPALISALLVDALGELVGYTTGPGRSDQTLSALEFHPERHLTAPARP